MYHTEKDKRFKRLFVSFSIKCAKFCILHEKLATVLIVRVGPFWIAITR